ncbi:hypothetical protein SBBP1_10018 [Burkholderiales bacterium]|nr:hypothetical protein SBBP1_10018 [Burkholderiales bacterium]
MIHPARRVDQILTDSALAAALLARLAAAREAARIIAPICAEVAPDFDPLRPGNCDLRERVLRIWLRSSAHSTKLRQATPRLLASLHRHGLEVNEIKVGVQPGRVREEAPVDAPIKGAMAQIGKAGEAQGWPKYTSPLAFAQKLALTLPDSSLRRAATNLGNAVAARLARMRELDQPFNKQDGEKDDPGTETGEKKTAGPRQVACASTDEIQQRADDDSRTKGKQ